ncbi:MAG: peptidylprolyl isomerase [Myxococcota bacterium]|jgi:cyclophilin family peptidyl-prolyl cis-trans isomerase|nr:MAG: Peptidyl-prolyl cis-trans isomerase B [Deltaproteobacteria bacterium ADurb.Bin058]HQC44844.1 peptidylprolyl isomerase [Myxococcota bacterium]HQL57657.1 peptidylprolyl isomerase [Myxococcota bacterium]
MRRVFAMSLMVLFTVAACATSKGPSEAKPVESQEKKVAVEPGVVKMTLTTNLGDIEMELYSDKAPKTVENITKLASGGFYEGILFHRVVPGFVIQVGDPLTKDPSQKARWGSGGPGFRFDDEPVKGEYERGALAMANAGPNTNGSQFFICLANLSGRLPKQYNLFGKVVNGMDVVDKIAALPRDARDCPTTDVKIEKVTVVK